MNREHVCESPSAIQSNRRPSALNKSPSLFYSHHNDMLCSVATIPRTAASFTCFCSAQITPEMVCVNELLQNSEKAKVRIQRRQDKVSSRLKDPNRRRAAPPQTRRDVQRLRVRQGKCLSSFKKNKIKRNTFRKEFSATHIGEFLILCPITKCLIGNHQCLMWRSAAFIMFVIIKMLFYVHRGWRPSEIIIIIQCVCCELISLSILHHPYRRVTQQDIQDRNQSVFSGNDSAGTSQSNLINWKTCENWNPLVFGLVLLFQALMQKEEL